MFRTVLVLLDGSSDAEAAIPFGIDQARRHRTPIVLIRVIPRPEPHPEGHLAHGGPAQHMTSGRDPELRSETAGAERYLAGVVARHRLPSSTSLVISVGDPAYQLTEEIQRHDHPLVVMVTDGAEGDRLSDVAHRVLLAGAAPLLGVRAHPVDAVIPVPAVLHHSGPESTLGLSD